MAKKSEAPPRYYHVEIVLGDRDDDLRTWCWNNPGLRGRAIRESLREWIAANPDATNPDAANTTAVTPSRAKSHSAPRPEAPSSFREPSRKPARAQASATEPSQPSDPASPARGPAEAPPPRDAEVEPISTAAGESTPPPQDAPASAPTQPGKVSDEARARLRRMLSGNKEFI